MLCRWANLLETVWASVEAPAASFVSTIAPLCDQLFQVSSPPHESVWVLPSATAKLSASLRLQWLSAMTTLLNAAGSVGVDVDTCALVCERAPSMLAIIHELSAAADKYAV